MKKPGGTEWIDNAKIYINMGSPWKNTHFLRFLHNEIQVIVTNRNAICKFNPLGYILYLSDFRNIEMF